jgi:hypothetical protein
MHSRKRSFNRKPSKPTPKLDPDVQLIKRIIQRKWTTNRRNEIQLKLAKRTTRNIDLTIPLRFKRTRTRSHKFQNIFWFISEGTGWKRC